MNILQIGTFDTKGGAAKVSYRLKKELESLGHTTSMFVHKKYSSDANIFEILQNKVDRALSKIFATDIHFGQSDAILYTDEFKKADVVHCHNLHGNFFKLSTLKKISQHKPIVWTLHDMWALSGHTTWGYDHKESSIPVIKASPELMWNNSSFLLNKKVQIFSHLNISVIPVSHWLEREVEQSFLNTKKTCVIHNGINTSVFKNYPKAESRKLLGLPNGLKIVSFISQGGETNPQKGWAFASNLIEHYKGRRDILFLCIGGNEEKKVDNVLYIPRINNEHTLARYYSSSDVFLFTSIAENFPLVTLEAMSCGVPVLAFDVGGTKEGVVHKQNGFIAEYKSVLSLTEGLEWLLGLPEKQKTEMSINCSLRVKNSFSLTTMTSKYVEVYKHLIHTHTT